MFLPLKRVGLEDQAAFPTRLLRVCSSLCTFVNERLMFTQVAGPKLPFGAWFFHLMLR